VRKNETTVVLIYSGERIARFSPPTWRLADRSRHDHLKNMTTILIITLLAVVFGGFAGYRASRRGISMSSTGTDL
jgi:hypothetical protein